MGKHVTDYLLYRWRYILGYGLIGLTVIGLLLLAGLFIPGGLSQDEVNSVVTSGQLVPSLHAFHPQWVIELPYHLLQRASIALFGVSQVSIKLPSLLLGILSVLGMIILLRTWFRQNVALITTALIITTGQFLFVAQSGTSGIMYIFWSVWLLVAAMMVSRRAKYGLWWKLLVCILAALSLYAPLSLYILIALASAALLHPHLRYIIRHLSKIKLTVGVLIGLVLLLPLGYSIWKDRSIGLTLLGIPSDMPHIKDNLAHLLTQYFDFISPQHGPLLTPVFSIGSLILILLGILRLLTTKYTARSYVISAWIILLLPILLINPKFISVTFVPILLLMGLGIETLLKTWYRLFPRNPYARIAGLIPLAIMIGGMVIAGIGRYTYGYLYDPHLTHNFSKDLRLVNRILDTPERGTAAIISTSAELPFYTIVAKYHKNVTATTAVSEPFSAATTIFTHDAHATTPVVTTPYRIQTGPSSINSDRFYIYKTDQK